MIKTLYTRSEIKYKGDCIYELPNGKTIEGVGISKFLYEKRSKTAAMRQGINVHEQIENNLRDSQPAATVLDWMDENLKERKTEVFVYGEQQGKSLIGFVDCIGTTKEDELVLIDVKTTRKPLSMQEGSTKWFVQCMSYILSLYSMTGVLVPSLVILAINPDTCELTVHTKRIADYSQLSIVLKSYLSSDL